MSGAYVVARPQLPSLRLPRFLIALMLLLPLVPALQRYERLAPSSSGLTPRPEQIPIAFEPNVGQSDPQVKFQARAVGGTLLFTAGDIVLALKNAAGARAGEGVTLLAPTVVRLHFAGANAASQIVGVGALPGVVNYIRGKDARAWRTGVPTYGSIVYNELYPGVSLRYDGNAGTLKGTYTVAPGADPRQIRWAYGGAGAIRVDPAVGDAHISLPAGAGHGAGELIESAPVVWQTVHGRRVPIATRYVLHPDNTLGFVVEHYDPALPLTIDPALRYSTFIGGLNSDTGNAIAVDGAGSAYVAGTTQSANLPVTNALDGHLNGTSDAFVAKLNPAGNGFVYTTYLGGSADDSASGIALDANGNAYVAGTTRSSDFPVVGAIQSELHNINGQPFVAKLSSSGTGLLYSTYLGGPMASGTGNAIAVDFDGNAYVTGTASPNFTLANPRQTTGNFYVAKLNPAGSRFVYSTYLGGITNSNTPNGIAVDWAGNAYLTGQTFAGDFPVANAYQPSCAFRPGTTSCSGDAFVLKLSADGLQIVYSTFFGGHGTDVGNGIAVSPAGEATIVGGTDSTDLPLLHAAQGSYGGGRQDAFVARLGTTGSALVFSTYLGGNDDEDYFSDFPGIALDDAGNTVVVGTTSSTNFPVLNAIRPTHRSGDADAFVTEYDPAGKLISSTLLGTDSGGDVAHAVAIDHAGDMYVTGRTGSAGFPLLGPAQGTIGGGDDGFVTKISGVPPVVTFSPAQILFDQQQAGVSSAPQVIIMTNTGQQTITVGPATVGGPQAADFAVTGVSCASITVRPGDTCAIFVVFTPRAGGLRYGSVTINSPAWPAPRTVLLRGKGAPTAVFDPLALEFPNQRPGTTSATENITIHNVGLEPLVLGAMRIDGTNGGEFHMVPPACAATTIAPDATCTVGIQFAPQTTGDRFGRLVVEAPTFDQPQTVPLHGAGGTAPSIALDGVDFGTCTGRLVTVHGSNFPLVGPGLQGGFQVFFDGKVGASGTTDASGSFNVGIRVPSYTGATHVISAADMQLKTATASVPVKAPRNDLPVILIPGVSASELTPNSNYLYTAAPDPNLAVPVPDPRQLIPQPFLYTQDNPVWLNGGGVGLAFTGSYRFVDTLQLQADGKRPQPDIFGVVPDLRVGNVLWDVNFLGQDADFYKTLRDTLLAQTNLDGSHKYVLNQTLFPFAYDWRKDVNETVDALDAVINQAMQASGKNQVVILAHSMGGLVARNYMLQRGTAKVDQLITLATPFLGAPMVGNVLENGDGWGIGWHFFGDVGLGMHPKEMMKLAQNFPSSYDLLPSRLYFNADPLDPHFDPHYLTRSQTKDGITTLEPLDYGASESFISGRHNAGLTTQSEGFRDGGLGDLSLLTGQIFHERIMGSQVPTIGNVTFSPRQTCATLPFIGLQCVGLPEFGAAALNLLGDGTVPLHSAMGANAPQDDRFYFVPKAEHNPINSNPTTLQLVTDMLSGNRCSNADPPFPNTSAGTKAPAAAVAPSSTATTLATGVEVAAVGSADLHVYDAGNHHLGPSSSTGYGVERAIPGAEYARTDGGQFATMTGNGSYTIVLRGNQQRGAAQLRITTLANGTTTQAMVFDSVPITGTTVATLTLTLPGPVIKPVLSTQYDVHSPVQSITPLPTLTGTPSQDLAPPHTTITMDANRNVTLSAQDTGGSGVAHLLYSTESPPVHYTEYTGPFHLSPVAGVTAFASDKAGNTEYPPAQAGQPVQIFLPLARR